MHKKDDHKLSQLAQYSNLDKYPYESKIQFQPEQELVVSDKKQDVMLVESS